MLKGCKTCGQPIPRNDNWGHLNTNHSFCGKECYWASLKANQIQRHCDHPDCGREFTLSPNQAMNYRQHERKGKLNGKRFYCSADCRLEDISRRGTERHEGNLSLAALDAYWQRVQDPTYYTGIRHGYATPLSFRDKGIKMARSTGARQ
jgi:hypothetical protein